MQTPLHLLLIEPKLRDAEVVTDFLCRQTRREIHVEHVSTLAAAFAAIKSHHYDVALLDLNLPEGSGLDLVYQLRNLDGRLPIVILTEGDDEPLALAAVRFGAQDCISKHAISGQGLFRAIHFAIARQHKMLGILAQACTDTLTGLPNRRHIDRDFATLLQQTRVDQTPLSLAILDIDHFKRVNDRHGHLAGDEVLKRIAGILRLTADEPIRLCRVGGEEFLMLLPDHAVDRAALRVRQVLQSIRTLPVWIAGTQLTVTCSAGVAAADAGDAFCDVFDKADQALYDAKRSGRDRVCIHSCETSLVRGADGFQDKKATVSGVS